jgi:hypothetical protein
MTDPILLLLLKKANNVLLMALWGLFCRSFAALELMFKLLFLVHPIRYMCRQDRCDRALAA